MGRTGFLIVLLEKIVEDIVRATRAVVKAVSQSIWLRLCERDPEPEGVRHTSGTAMRSDASPVTFGFMQWELVHQQFGSLEG